MVPRVIWPELDLNLSQLAFGCGPIMGRVGRREALNALALAYDQGVTHFDIARSYGFGDAEAVLGQFMVGKRGRVTVATKFGIWAMGLGRTRRLLRPVARFARRCIPALAPALKRSSARSLVKGTYDLGSVRRSVEISLSELRVEAVDILFVHDCSSADAIDSGLAGYLDDLRKAGKIRAWGLATAADEVKPVAAQMGRSPGVVQIPCAGSHRLDDYPARKILHGSISIAQRFFRGDGTPLPAALEWARQQGLEERQFLELLPRLLLRSALIGTRDAVVLCSMYTASHVRSNVEAVATDLAPSGLFPSFTHMMERVFSGVGSDSGSVKSRAMMSSK